MNLNGRVKIFLVTLVPTDFFFRKNRGLPLFAYIDNRSYRVPTDLNSCAVQMLSEEKPTNQFTWGLNKLDNALLLNFYLTYSIITIRT